MRSEADVFFNLADLCKSAGYVHTLAFICYRDNIVGYSENLCEADLLPTYSVDRLIRTEISTLIGLLIQGDINWSVPSADAFNRQIARTEALLKELHQTFLSTMLSPAEDDVARAEWCAEVMGQGRVLREVIFYGGESAYSFQYRDFAQAKYGADDDWLKECKGFAVGEARTVVHAIARLQEEKLRATLVAMATLSPDQRSLLPGFTFSLKEVAELSELPDATVESVLAAFSLDPTDKNDSFRAIDQFNVANAKPLLRQADNFVLFQSYSLAEALYESPFYWMTLDGRYAPTAMKNRGRFTESFCRDRLELVFGKECVHSNVDIFESKTRKARKLAEIDILVLFGDRVLVVQAKSKRLTIESRKGNDGQIRDDFTKSVQNSYDQGLICARHLSDPGVSVRDSQGQPMRVPRRVSEIYILCVVADHYPALNLQVRQFLKWQRTTTIQPPLALDVFALDAITEMLQSPLYFLSYLSRRSAYAERLMAPHETVILAYHLQRNLWIKNDTDLLMVGDDFSAGLDVAMWVRHDGVKGERTPVGVLTRFRSTAVGRIVSAIEASPERSIIDFGLLLLSLNEKAVLDASDGIAQIAEMTRRDADKHDLTLGFESPNTGFTVHCTPAPLSSAKAQLQSHCESRKYIAKAGTWFGICLEPSDESIRFGFKLEYEWRLDKRLERKTQSVPGALGVAAGRNGRVGRNDPCPCESGRKFKKCHGWAMGDWDRSHSPRNQWRIPVFLFTLHFYLLIFYGDLNKNKTELRCDAIICADSSSA